MLAKISRLLLALAAAGLAVDATLHWVFFGRSVLAIVGSSTLPQALIADFKVLWVADVSTLLAVALAFALAAARPQAASAAVLAALALIPGALGVLVFAFGAPSYAGVNMLAAAGVALLAALLKARSEAGAPASRPVTA